MASERASSALSVRSLDSTTVGSKTRQENAFYEECKSTYLSLLSSIDDRIHSKDQLYTLLTRSGRSPSKQSMAKHWPQKTEYLSYTQFCIIMRSEKSYEKDAIIDMFNYLDANDEGCLSRESLASFLTNNGEPFSPSELEEMFRVFENAARGDGMYDYTKMTSIITQTSSDCVQNHKIVLSNVAEKEKMAKNGVKKLSEKSVAKLRSKIEPKGFSNWTKITKNGFLTYQEKNLQTTAFEMTLASSCSVFISTKTRSVVHKPKMDIEVLLLCVKLDQSGSWTDTVYLSDATDGESFFLKADLPAGNYSVLPFTFSSKFLPRKSQPSKPCNLIQPGTSNSELSAECEKAIDSLFELIDVDGDGSISRDELDLFQMMCSGEKFDDEDWKGLQEMWEVVDDCITRRGFIDLHKMEAREDPADLWNSFSKMGFNDSLLLDQSCPIKVVFAVEKDNNATIKVDKKCSNHKAIESALCELAENKRKGGKTKSYEDINVTTYKQNQVGLITVDNIGKENKLLKLDFSKSSNVQLVSDFKEMMVGPQKKKIAQLCLPMDASKEIVIKWQLKT